MKQKLVFLVTLLAAGRLLAAPAARETLVLIPFANIAGSETAPDIVESALAARLAEKGYRVFRGDDVRAFLASERVRYVDSLAGPVRQKLLAKFEARGVVLGAICAFEEGENPIVGLSMRFLDEQGKTVWSNSVGLTGDDSEDPLGFKRVASAEQLAAKSVARLLGGFPSPGSRGHISGARGGPFAASGPRTYRSAVLASGKEYRIVVLPLLNRAPDRVAPRLVGELLVRRLSASKLFEVVEPSDFREAMVSARLRGLQGGDPAELKKLGDALGTNLVLTGMIFKYRDTSPRNGSIVPELELQLTLTDTAAGEIIWMGTLARRGTDYTRFFGLGGISNMTTLADQVAAEMVRGVEKARGKTHPTADSAAKAAPPSHS